MTQQDLVKELRKQPFEPFRIHLTDGSAFDIGHPEMMLVGRTTAYVFYPPAGMQLPAFDRWELVSLSHITRLEPLALSAA